MARANLKKKANISWLLLPQFSFSKLRQPTGQKQSNVRTQQKRFNWANLILIHIMRKVGYHQIWVQNHFGFIVSDLYFTYYFHWCRLYIPIFLCREIIFHLHAITKCKPSFPDFYFLLICIIYKGINPMGLLVLFYLSQICTRFGIRGQARIVFLMAYFVATSFLSASLGKVSIQPIRET